MNFLRNIFLSLIAICLQMPVAYANVVTTERTEATLLSDVSAIHAGQKFWAVLHIKMQPGWHTYWKNPGDSGTTPSLSWTLPKEFTAGEVQYLAPERQQVGPLVDYGYSDDAYFFVTITPPAILGENTTSILALKGEWLVCKDVCVPERADLSLILPASQKQEIEHSADAELIDKLVGALPIVLETPVNFSLVDEQIHFTVPLSISAEKIKTAQFFPAQDGLIANASPQQVSITKDGVAFAVKKAEGKPLSAADGLVSIFPKEGERKNYEVHLQFQASVAGAPPSPYSAQLMPVITSMLFALLGGLILNLMPCVFPILSLKCLAIAKKSAAHASTVRLQGIAYAAGVILSFLILAALLITIQSGGKLVGWGYQMQSPVFVTALAYLLFIVGLNLSGYFELPVLLGDVGGEAVAKDNSWSSFWTGMLAVVVATPCTAPFMASAVGFALTQSIPVILAVFICLGLGLASPFLLISLFPRLATLLPKPGMWMLRFKQFLAFPMYLSVVWLVWVLAREVGADGVGIALLGIVFLTFALWLWQRDSLFVSALGAILSAVIIITTLFSLHVMPGGKAASHLQAEPFSMARLDALRAEDKAVFVDATADWCITCKVNETVALSSQTVKSAFADKHITYLVADWTNDDMEITKYLASFGRRGVPIYVYYPPNKGEPVVLPQILTPSIVLKVINP